MKLRNPFASSVPKAERLRRDWPKLRRGSRWFARWEWGRLSLTKDRLVFEPLDLLMGIFRPRRVDVPLTAIDVLGYRNSLIVADPMKESAGRGWLLISNPYRYGEMVIVTKDHREWRFTVTDLPGWLNAISDAMDALGIRREHHG